MSSLGTQGVTVSGRTRPRLDRLTVTFAPGALTVIVGPNGAGKSTLLRVLAGLQGVDAGEVRVDGRSLAGMSARERAAKIAWLPQQGAVEEGLTAVELVAAARFRFSEPWRLAREAAHAALGALGAAAWAETPMTRLSGGEAQRVRLASLVAQDAAWWLLDEPANHLDPSLRLELLDRVCARAAAGQGVVMVTHDLASLGAVGDAFVVALQGGALAHTGRTADSTMPAVLGGLFGVDLRALDHDGQRPWVVLGRAR